MLIFETLENFPWALGALVIVAFFVSFSTIGLLIMRKIVDFKVLKNHHDVAGFVFTNIGVLYAVLLGFTVVNVQQRYDKIKEISQIEASILAELYEDAEVFSPEDRDLIRQSIRDYFLSVIYVEWPTMSNGNPSEETIHALKSIWRAYYVANLENKKQEIWYSQSISKLNELMNTRLSRLLGAKESLGAEMWTLLIFGAFIMVAFMWIFGLESLKYHFIMATILASSTAFLLFLIYSLDTAFSGGVSIPPTPFMRVLHTFHVWNS